MKYKVTFRKRFNAVSQGVDDPTCNVEPPEGVILDKAFVEDQEPEDFHIEENTETSGEDNGFLTLGTETWVYDVDGSRCDEFEFALKNSQVVLDYEVIDEEAGA